MGVGSRWTQISGMLLVHAYELRGQKNFATNLVHLNASDDIGSKMYAT